MIPQVAHFFWTDQPMSFARYLTLHSFCRLNPDWQAKLWIQRSDHWNRENCEPWQTPERQEFYSECDLEPNEFAYSGEQLIEKLSGLKNLSVCEYSPPEKTPSPVHASDLFSWWVLANHGGLYCDLDVLWVQPIGEYLQKSAADVLMCLWGPIVTVGLMGASESGRRLFGEIHKFATRQLDQMSTSMASQYQSLGSDCFVDYLDMVRKSRKIPLWPAANSGVRTITLRSEFPDLNFCNLPKEFVYPFGWRQVPLIWEQDSMLPVDCHGIHWFGGSAVSQRHARLLTESNLVSLPDSTFVRYAREVL